MSKKVFPYLDYSMAGAALQKGVLLLAVGVFALAIARMFLTALLAPFLGQQGAGLVVSVVFLGVVLFFAQHAVHAMQGGFLPDPLAGVMKPLQEIVGILNSAASVY